MYKVLRILLLLSLLLIFSTGVSYGKSDRGSSKDIKSPNGYLSFSATTPVQSSFGVDVILYCEDEIGGSGCSKSYVSRSYSQNGTYSLTVEDKAGNKTTKTFSISNIDDTPPTGELYFSHTQWTNSDVTVELSCSDTDLSGGLRWCIPSNNVVGIYDSNGTYELSIMDSAGNTFSKEFNISNIDKLSPIYHLEYATLSETDITQIVKLNCVDEDLGSGCKQEVFTYEIPLGNTGNLSIEDNAGNIVLVGFSTANSSADYSDRELPWTNNDRYIWIDCSDDLSGCVQDKVDDTISNNTPSVPLQIMDHAGNSVTRNFEISKIDKTKPVVFSSSILGKNYWKASDSDKLRLGVFDLGGSELEISKYSWDTDNCWEGNNYSKNNKINFTTSLKHTLNLCAKDFAGNEKVINKEFTIYPGDVDSMASELTVDSRGDKYANNVDFYNYNLFLKDKYTNPIYDKNIDLVYQDINGFDGGKTLVEDMVSLIGNDVINEFGYSNFTDENGKMNFKINSTSPGNFTERFTITLNNWGNNYADNLINQNVILSTGESNFFKKPLKGLLKIVEGGIVPEIGKNQSYKIQLSKDEDNSINGFGDGNININSGTILNKIEGHFWNTFGGVTSVFGNTLSSYLGFSGSIDANDNILKGANVGINNLDISYNLGGNYVKYFLDNFEVVGCDTTTLGLKVIGNLQGDGKGNITGQEENFSDISKSELRYEIRKNGYSLIKGLDKLLDNGIILNGVKYVEGDYIIAGNDLGFETLIIKNGNLIISGDLNTNNDKLGIIILKDNYLLDSDYSKAGNIYVDKSISYIDAIIYADGTFRSADSLGNSYSDFDINNSLELFGSLFTRNTIGGAVKAGDEYVLPGGEKVADYNLAQIYDLNYVRKLTNSCGDNYAFLIRYNPKVQTDFPIGFSIK